jgi:predicted alpha/beta-fold hydrolase
MRLVPDQDIYKVPLPVFKNSYIQTIFAKIFRPVSPIKYIRERICAKDNVFLDLDWSRVSSKSLTIVIDGLEGNSSRSYTRSVVTALNQNGIDALAINFRGCSGEKTHEYFLQYGETDDLRTIINHVLKNTDYQDIFLVGCSVGGNLITEYLGEIAADLDPRIKKAFLVSATIDLDSTCKQLHVPANWIYLKMFLFILMLRVWQMRKSFKRKIRLKEFFMIKTFTDFYYHFVYEQKEVLLHKYFKKNSSRDTLNKISIPTCLLYAKDDPFLTEESFPYKEAKDNSMLKLIMTDHGGHVGFVDFSKKYYFSEELMLNFLLKGDYSASL